MTYVYVTDMEPVRKKLIKVKIAKASTYSVPRIVSLKSDGQRSPNSYRG